MASRPTTQQMEDQVFEAIQKGANTPDLLVAALPNAYRDEILSAVWRMADLGEVDFTKDRKVVAKKRHPASERKTA